MEFLNKIKNYHMGKAVMIGMMIGSIIGGYIPLLWGDSAFSMTAVFTSAIGGFLGIFISYKISSAFF